jgi:signal transduction histidine kinase
MPQPEMENFNVLLTIRHSAEIFVKQENFQIELAIKYENITINADKKQMLRVFNNLIQNAQQAIPFDRKGLLKIICEIENNRCIIRFQDNGKGIPEEMQEFIFSPNFTTKSTGMGLGLAMVKSIIEGFSGKIWFETTPNEGTTFFISLPVTDNQ